MKSTNLKTQFILVLNF